MISHEYVVSIAVVIVGILQLFGIVLDQEVIVGLIVGVLGLYGAFRTKKSQNLTVFGMKR